MEAALKCKVVNEYGSAETGLIAYECPNGSMHICEEVAYVTEDSENNILVTELYNESMPLINYNLNDKVSLDNKFCSCNRNSRIISNIGGRVDDFIECQDGSKMSQYFFYYIVKDLDSVGFMNSILKYKIIQHKNTFRFYIISGKNYSQNVENYILNRMYEKIGQDIEVKFILVNSIPREKGGKLRFFVKKK